MNHPDLLIGFGKLGIDADGPVQAVQRAAGIADFFVRDRPFQQTPGFGDHRRNRRRDQAEDLTDNSPHSLGRKHFDVPLAVEPGVGRLRRQIARRNGPGDFG